MSWIVITLIVAAVIGLAIFTWYCLIPFLMFVDFFKPPKS